MKRIWMLVCICMLLCGLALAQEAPEVAAGMLTASLPVKGGHVQVYSTQVDGEEWLLLPAFADMDALQLTMDGESVLWEDVTEEDGVWTGDAVKDGETLFTLSAMRSENLRALFLFSDDPVNQGREYIESSKKHENQTTGAMAIVNVDGKVDHADDLRQLRGRGNSTWFLEKKPYQFKLENRADLLNTGVKSERSRTWVLLADFYDSTMLHNRVMLDLGLEIGLAETSHSEHVDLYYDGEYRGLYLLCEKVEVDEARLDWDDYDAVIDAINKSAGIRDLSVLEAEVGEQETGYYSYIRDLAEPEDPSVGTYMVEMENPAITLSDRCWFYLDDGSVLALKNPENASKNMVSYISARLAEAQKTLIHGGVNPETGRTLSDDFDVEGFARNLLLQELAHNADGYTYSSSWFILPAQQTRFEAGPLWDFDLSLRIRREGTNAEGVGLRALKSWPQLFYGCDAFVETMQRIYREEIAPVVEKILLGSEQGRYLRPLQEYVREIRAARAMNERIWPGQRYFEFCYEEGFDAEIEAMRRFLEKRHAWLSQALADARPYSADTITLWGNAEYGHVDTNLNLNVCTWNNVDIVSCEWDMVSEATEEDYAVYELEAEEAGSAEIKFGGKKYLYVYAPVGKTGIMTCGLIPYSNIMAEAANIRSITVILVILAIIVAMVVGSAIAVRDRKSVV